MYTKCIGISKLQPRFVSTNKRDLSEATFCECFFPDRGDLNIEGDHGGLVPWIRGLIFLVFFFCGLEQRLDEVGIYFSGHNYILKKSVTNIPKKTMMVHLLSSYWYLESKKKDGPRNCNRNSPCDFTPNKNKNIHSGKLTWRCNIHIFNRKYIFKWSIFHCHVSLPEGSPRCKRFLCSSGSLEHVAKKLDPQPHRIIFTDGCFNCDYKLYTNQDKWNMAASPNMHQHFDCLGSEEYHISHFLHVQTASHLNWLVKYG